MIITIFLYQISYLHSYKRNIFFQSSLIILYIFFYFVKNPININCRLKQKQKKRYYSQNSTILAYLLPLIAFISKEKK